MIGLRNTGRPESVARRHFMGGLQIRVRRFDSDLGLQYWRGVQQCRAIPQNMDCSAIKSRPAQLPRKAAGSDLVLPGGDARIAQRFN